TDAVPADVLLQRLGRLHRHRAGTVPTAVVLDPGNWDQSVSADGRPLGGPDDGWAWIYNPLPVRETIEWLRIQGTISVPANVREIVELATHADHLKNRAEFYGGRWVALWQYVFGNATADAQQALAGLIDRQLGYEQALVNERVPTRLGDGSVDVEVRGNLRSPFTQSAIDALSIRANWLRGAQPGSIANVVGVDDLGHTLLDVNGVSLAYGVEGLALIYCGNVSGLIFFIRVSRSMVQQARYRECARLWRAQPLRLRDRPLPRQSSRRSMRQYLPQWR